MRDMRSANFISKFAIKSNLFEKVGLFDTTYGMKKDSLSGIQGAGGVYRVPPLLTYLTLTKASEPVLQYWRIWRVVFLD